MTSEKTEPPDALPGEPISIVASHEDPSKGRASRRTQQIPTAERQRQVGKALNYLLRHGAKKHGVSLDKAGTGDLRAIATNPTPSWQRSYRSLRKTPKIISRCSEPAPAPEWVVPCKGILVSRESTLSLVALK